MPHDDIIQAKGGNQNAFGRLVRAHQNAVRGFCRRLCTHESEADDLAQEAFVMAWKRIEDLKEGVALKSFVCGFAYRLARNQRRSLMRAFMRNAQWLGLKDDWVKPEPEASLTAQSALMKLSVEQRAAIILCLIEDHSHAQAAEILGLPLGTIKSHIERGRARLQILFKEAGHQ